MAAPGESHEAEQRPNMWEELNRPRSEQRRGSPPPPAPTFDASAPEVAGLLDTASPEAVPSNAASNSTHDGEATAADRIDPQHLLLVGAALFVGVAVFALGGLGGSSNTPAPLPAPSAATTPDMLAEVDNTLDAETDEPTVSTPTTVQAAQTMAMGLPASLLDSEQSQVYRLYRTALGREPDRSGFEFWSSQVRSGVPLAQLANDFLASDEYQAQFSDGAEWDSRAELLLTNAFGIAADRAELDLWRERFAGLDGADLLLAISEADETLVATGTLR